jgi:anaerobic selenocysteine-containing dehydrogenase
MRIHPEDAKTLGLEAGELAECRSARGQIAVVVERDESLRRGVVTVAHGYGNRHAGSEPIGPQINRLTSLAHCDPFSHTPYHKHIPVSIGKRAGTHSPAGCRAPRSPAPRIV